MTSNQIRNLIRLFNLSPVVGHHKNEELYVELYLVYMSTSDLWYCFLNICLQFLFPHRRCFSISINSQFCFCFFLISTSAQRNPRQIFGTKKTLRVDLICSILFGYIFLKEIIRFNIE